MSLQNCLAKLVAAKRITQKAADDALALHNGIQDRLYPAMGPATADAAGALEAARVMAEAARERKMEAAVQAIRQAEIFDRMQKHPRGQTVGLISALVRDNWEAGRATGNAINIDSHSEAVTKRLFGIMGGTLDKYRSTMAGLRQDTESIWNVVDELFGRDTGDQSAQVAAKAFQEATGYAVDRVKRAGKRLSVLDDWRLPQFWDASRTKAVTEREFVDDLMQEVRAGTMRVMDKEGQGEAPATMIPGIIQNAYKDITLGRGVGAAGPSGFSNQLRVFRFDNPDAYKRLMKKYGVGDGGLYNTLVGHLSGMGKEIAFTEILGPKYEQNFNTLWTKAERADAENLTGRQKFKNAISMNSPQAAKRTFDALSGKLGVAQSELLAGLGGGLRNIQTFARLGSATVAALPGDSVTTFLAANHTGIPATAILGRLVRDLVNDEKAEAIARQVNLTANMVMDNALGSKRFADEIVGQGITARVADTIMRASGLTTWTEGLKRAFSMEFMGAIARESDKKFEVLDPLFRGFFERYGFTAADWDKLRVTPQLEADGARFFDVNGVEDQRLADRLMSAIIDERHMAVLEPDARIRGAMTGGKQRGSISGEAIRSITQFKSFPMTYMMTHLMRAAVQDGNWSKAYYGAKLLTLTTIAGAVTMQMQSIIAGRDPNDMSRADFWTQSFIRGGGGGLLADFVNSSVSRGGQGLTESLLGPGPSAIISAADFAENGFSGRALAQYMKGWLPGTTLWYSKLATDRIFFDQLQTLLDPDYRKSFRRYEKRMKKEFGQTFWGAPGNIRPDRKPRF